MPLSWSPWSSFLMLPTWRIFCWPLALAAGKEGAGWVWQPAGPVRLTGAGHTVALPVTPGAPSSAIEDVPRVTRGWREPD